MSDNPYSRGPQAGGNPYGVQGGYGTQNRGPAGQMPSSTAAKGARPAPPAKLQGFGGGAAAVPAKAPGELIKDTTTASFAADVIQESRRQPVIVDFWAPWCGPCKQLTPIIEKVVTAAGGRVKLVKMDIDKHPAIAGQLGVQSIPAVFAFVDGQPVDGFMGALPESEVRAFVDRLITGGKGAGAGDDDPVAAAFAQACDLLGQGDIEGAAQYFGAILQHDPAHAGAAGGLAECYLAMGRPEEARGLVDEFSAANADPAQPGKAEDPAIAAVRAKLKLADEIAELGDEASLQARIEGDADDHQARFDLALIAQARGERATAAGHLLEIVRRDRSFLEDGARSKLLEFFEAWGGDRSGHQRCPPRSVLAAVFLSGSPSAMPSPSAHGDESRARGRAAPGRAASGRAASGRAASGRARRLQPSGGPELRRCSPWQRAASPGAEPGSLEDASCGRSFASGLRQRVMRQNGVSSSDALSLEIGAWGSRFGV